MAFIDQQQEFFGFEIDGIEFYEKLGERGIIQ
jgi:hypothetical protein